MLEIFTENLTFVLMFDMSKAFALLKTITKAKYCVRTLHDLFQVVHILFFICQNTAYAYINGSVQAAYSVLQKKVFFNVTGVEQSPLIPGPVPYDTALLYDFHNVCMIYFPPFYDRL